MMKNYLQIMRDGGKLNTGDQIQMVVRLSLPSILAQLSSVVMQYIDAAMVGRLGENASASIGLVASSTWLFAGICDSFTVGFAILIAQFLGAKDTKNARAALKESFLVSMIFTFFVTAVALILSPRLPYLLGGGPDIAPDGYRYFAAYIAANPIVELCVVAISALQANGDMKVTGRLYTIMCALDVCFNAFFIFPEIEVFGMHIPGLGLGVLGAALGTDASEITITFVALYFCLVRSPELHIRKDEKLPVEKARVLRGIKLSLPVCFERGVMSGAQMVMTSIVAPLGNVAIAAHSFAITVESLCYLPGNGVQRASTTVIGQSVGAGRKDLTKRLGWVCTLCGMAVMSFTGLLMYIFAVPAMRLLSPSAAVVALGASVLRIEAFAEPLYAASIVALGVCRGTGDTLAPSLMNFGSMWLVRLPMAAILAKRMGLSGVWTAMCIELCFRGTIFLVRLARGRWMDAEEVHLHR